MGVLEREVSELSGRVAACRQCLVPSQRSQPLCGGGPAWRDAKQRAKHLRKLKRSQRKSRGKKKGGRKADVSGLVADAPEALKLFANDDVLLSDVNQEIT